MGSDSPAAAEALAVFPLEPNIDENDGMEMEGDEQPAIKGASKTSAAMPQRRCDWNSNAPTPNMPKGLGP